MAFLSTAAIIRNNTLKIFCNDQWRWLMHWNRVQGSPSQLRQALSGTVQTEHTLLVLETSQPAQYILAYQWSSIKQQRQPELSPQATSLLIVGASSQCPVLLPTFCTVVEATSAYRIVQRLLPGCDCWLPNQAMIVKVTPVWLADLYDTIPPGDFNFTSPTFSLSILLATYIRLLRK